MSSGSGFEPLPHRAEGRPSRRLCIAAKPGDQVMLVLPCWIDSAKFGDEAARNPWYQQLHSDCVEPRV